ncbi:MAG: 5-(carboxyamino)imidazole ribonucleotide mutase [Clostridia bacterium]|nr:5-(carboxyamino)imidazole ribonucleotide mutase [Clostridia bacterium]
MKKVAIVMGSKSDLSVVKPAYEVLTAFNVECAVRVLSAHRTPTIAADFAANARAGGYGVIIAAAGKAAHLAGVIAGHTTLPVIGLPVKSSTMDGLDSLLSVVQMPSGVPVATVAINGAENAGLLAVQMLAIDNSELADKLAAYKKDMQKKVLADDEIIMSLVNAK